MKLTSIILWVLMIVCIVVAALSLLGDVHNPMLYTSYILLVIVSIIAVGSGIAAVISKGTFKNVIIGLGAVGATVLVSYLFSSDQVLPLYGDITSATSRISDVLLICMYICMALAIGSVVYSSISRLLK